MMKKILLICFAIYFWGNLFSSNFNVTTSTYIGSSSSDEAINAVDIAPDGTIVVGGVLPESFNPGGLVPTELLGGGTGVVIRYSSDAKTILSVTRIVDSIFDLEIGENGEIAVCGDFGVGVLNSVASDFVWSDLTIKTGTLDAHQSNFYIDFAASTAVKRRYMRALSSVSIGKDGTVATMQVPVKYWYVDPPECYVYVYDKDGNKLFDFVSNDEYPEDIAVDGTNKVVIHGGWNAEHAPYGGNPEHPIHVPFMRAYDYSGNELWRNYNWTAAACYAQNYFADSRVQVMTIGEDGFLYMGGYIHGGDNLWMLGPKDITDRPGVDTHIDIFSQAVGMGQGMDLAYFAKFNPVNGDILKGQALIARESELASGLPKPRQIQIKGIDADENGVISISGYTQNYILNRSQNQINGTTVGAVTTSVPYAEPFYLELDSSWNSRNVWTVFSKSNCEGASWGCAYRNGLRAVVGTIYIGEIVTTTSAPQSVAQGVHDGFLITWGNYVQTNTVTNTEVNIVFYPNPASSILRSRGGELENAEIFDMQGRKVLFFKGKNNVFDVSVLETGIYIISADGVRKIFMKN